MVVVGETETDPETEDEIDGVCETETVAVLLGVFVDEGVGV